MRILIPVDLSPSVDVRLKNYRVQAACGHLQIPNCLKITKRFNRAKLNRQRWNTKAITPSKTTPPVLATTTTKNTTGKPTTSSVVTSSSGTAIATLPVVQRLRV